MSVPLKNFVKRFSTNSAQSNVYHLILLSYPCALRMWAELYVRVFVYVCAHVCRGNQIPIEAHIVVS